MDQEKKRNPNYAYFKSSALGGLECAVWKKEPWLYVEDGTVYSPQEIERIKQGIGEITMPVHLVKKYFSGEILEVKVIRENSAEQKPPAAEPSTVPKPVPAKEDKNLELEIF